MCKSNSLGKEQSNDQHQNQTKLRRHDTSGTAGGKIVAVICFAAIRSTRFQFKRCGSLLARCFGIWAGSVARIVTSSRNKFGAIA